MNFITDYRVEQYILETRWENLPPEVQERARVCALDLMMALILGSRGKQFEAGVRLARLLYQEGNIPVVGSKETFSLMGAAAVMAHASNSFDIDDGHTMVCGHPGASFIAGLLACAIRQDVDYQEFLTALVVGYDVAVRNGLAEQKHYGYFHSTGTYGAVGTCAVAGRLMGLTQEQLNNAISIADFHAPLTPAMRAAEYPSMNKDGVPFGTLVGMMAYFETCAGTTGRTHLLELEELREYTATLGKEYEIMNLYFKPYTCCRWTHQPIAAIADLREKYGITEKDVAALTVHTFGAAARLSKIVPRTTDEAQYNIAFPVAAALVHGDVGYCQVREEALDDSRVLDTMKKLSFVVEPELDAQFPAKRLAWVELLMKNGTMLRSGIYAADGEADDRVGIDWIERKFRRITGPLLGNQAQENLIELLLKGDLTMRVRELVQKVNEYVL